MAELGTFLDALPMLPPRYVPRPRLIAALNDVSGPNVTLLAAGAGSGKTALLSDWARQQDAPVAWLSLTPLDDDPQRFWRRFLSALAVTSLEPDLPFGLPAAVSDLIESTVAGSHDVDQPVIMVLDDVDVLRDPAIRAGLDDVIRLWQHRLRLVLAARSDPLLRLSRHRLDGKLIELRAAQLAMTPAEARLLLDAHDVSLPQREFDALLRRTEGWTAGLRLSALRMQGLEAPAEFIAELDVDQGSIGEYLLEEVLDHQPEPVRRLLIETSFLSEVSGSLAEAVTGIDGAGAMLDELTRTNSFVVPADRTRTRFRVHHLFREILHYLLQRRTADEMQELYRRAGQHYEHHGDTAQALAWYVQAGENAGVADLLIRGGLVNLHLSGDPLSTLGLDRFLSEEEPLVPNDSWTLISAARLARIAADGSRSALDEAVAWRTGLASRSLNNELQVALAVTAIQLGQAAGAWEEVVSAAEFLLQDYGPALDKIPGFAASVMLSQTLARFWLGDQTNVIALLQAALVSAEAAQHAEVQLDVLGALTFVNAVLARPQQATRMRRRALDLLSGQKSLRAPITLALAEIRLSYRRAEFEVTARLLRQISAVEPSRRNAAFDAVLILARSRLLLACGQVLEAKLCLDDNTAIVGSAGGMFVSARASVLAEIEVALGRPNGALRLLDRFDSPVFRDSVLVRRAEAYLALGDLESAQQSVRSLLTSTNDKVTRVDLVEATLCAAQIEHRSGNEIRCIDLLARAVEISEQDIVLPFARVADVFATILRRHPTLAASWPVPVGNPDGPPDELATLTRSVETRMQLADPLTERERTVLRYLVTSMSTAEIANELYLSVNTVKTHLAAIYRKLAARRRREAVMRARELELL